jgi:site-specific recombinase
MQSLGFKLATKQPALFAGAIAAKVQAGTDLQQLPEWQTSLFQEIRSISQSQTAAVLGNIGMVIPIVLAFEFLWTALWGSAFLELSQAKYALTSLDPFNSGTIGFAALTGVILFVSSLVGCWFENMLVFRSVPDGIAQNRLCQRWLGTKRAKRLSQSIVHHAAGVGTSVTLGLLLGLVPVFGQFFGLGLDVRHVTLSMGQLALGASSLGIFAFDGYALVMAGLGVFIIGFLNFAVSFLLGLLLAARSRDLSLHTSVSLLSRVAVQFLYSPFAFFAPARPTKTAPHETNP